jgi:hypothetical protein
MVGHSSPCINSAKQLVTKKSINSAINSNGVVNMPTRHTYMTSLQLYFHRQSKHVITMSHIVFSLWILAFIHC